MPVPVWQLQIWLQFLELEGIVDHKSVVLHPNQFFTKKPLPMQNSGKFIPFLLNYKENDDSQQANIILSEATKLIQNNAKGVAIIYSANYGQTLTINKTYAEGDWQTGISGANQASVMMSMESLLDSNFSDLQKAMRIAPITTMTYSSSGYGGHTHKEVVVQDLSNIKALLERGWTVLGWMNQDTDPKYAVGGGIASSIGSDGKVRFPKALSDYVQTTLSQFAEDYS